jgi:hypothetical protein
MRPRRSRFTRIYHRLTRRAPNRRGQWEQIVQLRPHGSVGHPTAVMTLSAPEQRSVSRAVFQEDNELTLENLEEIELLPEGRLEPAQAARGSGAVAALTGGLFLLACAYAAFSGYTHSYDNGLACLGILGAVGCLIAAGTGISLAASGLVHRHGVRFVGVCAVFLAGLYGLLLFFAAGGR